jgi:hypothetical protein
MMLPFAAATAQQTDSATRICLAPTTAQMADGNADAAADAVRATFTEFLTGPSLSVKPLAARVSSQARVEAKQAGCSSVLFTTLKHKRHEGSGFLGRMAGSVAGTAVEVGASQALGSASSATSRVAASAAVSAAGAVREVASSFKAKDELSLTYRLETTNGQALAEGTDKRKAKSDAEDLLTPLVQQASEAVAGAAAKRAP